MKAPLANQAGVSVVLTLLMGSGAMCPTCGHGTRVTSKRWARCKNCGQRVERVPMAKVADDLTARLATTEGATP